MSLQPFLLALLDPRGRCNRKGLVLAALLMVAAEIVLGLAMWASGRMLDDPLVLTFKAALVYLAFSAASQRLHDLGRSALWIPVAMLALIAWAFALAVAAAFYLPPERMAPGETGFAIVFAGLVVPMLATLAWLHFAPGIPSANRFGPAPDRLGFARAARATPDTSALEAAGAA